MRRPPETKVPGPRSSGNRATRQGKAPSSFQSTPPEPNARRPRLSRPFPCPSLRYYFGWPEGLAYAVGLTWQAGRREAA